MTKKIIKILLIILVIGLIYYLITLTFSGYNNRVKGIFTLNYKHSSELILNEKYEENFNSIIIKAEAADIYIKNSEDNLTHVKIYGEKDNTTVKTNNNLEITNKIAKCIGFCINREVSIIELYIPSNYDKKITIKSNFGNIKVEDFKDLTLTIDIDAGNIEVGNIKEGNIKTNAGNIDVASSKTLTVKDNAGNIKVDKVDDITATNNAGNITINEVNNYLKIQDDAGEIKINTLNINKNSSIKNNMGNVKIGKTNDIYIDGTVNLGNMKINNNNKDSNITLTIKCDLGDIKINN